MKELVRGAKRTWVIVGAATVVLGGIFGITVAVAKSLSLEARVIVLERHDREAYGHLGRVDAKLDFIALQFGIAVPLNLRAPPAWSQEETR